MLEIFKQDAFKLLSLTDAINKLPFIPGRAGMIAGWQEQGVNTLSVMIEEREGVLTLVNPTPRGGPGSTVAKVRRGARSLVVPHHQIDDAIYADEVQGVREFGTEDQLQTVQGIVNQRQLEHVQLGLDPTLEFYRVGAIKGIILNPDGTTLYNLFTEFGVSQHAEVAFDLSAASPANGVLRKTCAGVVRDIADALGAAPVVGIHAFCGNAFFDDLLSHKEVTDSYKNTPMAEVLRQGYVYPNGMMVYGAFEFGGIVWENYRGSANGSAFVNTDKCHIFPVGVPGLWRTVYAPADYVETVNTLGRPRYTKQFLMDNDKGVRLESQMNALNYCRRPATLIQGKRGA